MFFIKLLRLISGYVHFYAGSGFTERFINLCSLNSIPLWGLKTTADGITAYTTPSSYRRIRSCATKAGMKLKLKGRHGLPFFLKRYRKRAGLLVGLALFFAIISFLSTMIWTIEISGNRQITDEEILSVLAETGLKPGTPKSNLNAPEIRFYALSRLPKASYLAVNLVGSSVHIVVTERIETTVTPVEQAPCDVVSTIDGQLAVLEVYEGTKMFETGQAVRKGNVLAAGFEELSNGTVRLRHAKAYALVTAETAVQATAEQTAEFYSLSHSERHITLHFFGLNIPLFIKSDETPHLTRSAYLTVNGTRLPFGFTEKIYNTYTKKKCKLSKTELALTTAENYFLQKNKNLENATIIKENVSTQSNRINAAFTAQFSAGVAKEMLIE